VFGFMGSNIRLILVVFVVVLVYIVYILPGILVWNKAKKDELQGTFWPWMGWLMGWIGWLIYVLSHHSKLYCVKCGAQIDPNDISCKKCGTLLKEMRKSKFPY
jgi:ribosomal protein L40E